MSSSRYLDDMIQGDSIYSLQNGVWLLVRSGGQSLSTNLLKHDLRVFQQHQVLRFHLVPTGRRTRQVSWKISAGLLQSSSSQLTLLW